jgi:hypothetical protein
MRNGDRVRLGIVIVAWLVTTVVAVTWGIALGIEYCRMHGIPDRRW